MGFTFFAGETLVDLLRRRAEEQGDAVLYTYLSSSGEVESTLSFAELERRARAIAASLEGRAQRGDRALMLYPPGLDFIAAFFGCLAHGVVAVPAYPPDPTRLARGLPRLLSIVKDARPRVVLTTAAIASLAAGLAPLAPQLAGIPFVATDEVDLDGADRHRPLELDRGTLAFFQYTSGSTGEPKGVMVSHGDLLGNEELIRRIFGLSERSIVVGWLPLYHDMGLIGAVLQPLYLGARCILLSPMSFLKRPVRWLEAMTRFHATTSPAPNFGYDLCARKVTAEEKSRLDLSSWEQAINGAEPIRRETLERFSAAFAPCGFSPRAFYPCFGLAEATLVVTGGPWSPMVPEAPPARTIAGSGRVPDSLEVAIVEPESRRRCEPGRVGEIWVRGASLPRGYWNHPAETEEVFQAFLADTGEGPFLRTGDLGVLDGGELFVTGRIKDLIIVRGQNHYPSDVEWAAERTVPGLRPGSCAAFSLDTGRSERVVVAAEVDARLDPDRGGALDPEAIADAVRSAVAGRCGLTVHDVVLVRAGSLPKTSSGKLQRRACREALLSGGLEVLARSSWSGGREAAGTEEAGPLSPGEAAAPRASERV
jgi:acyl-CoA synthetase (AMP-forming)/AMP-acid ligase II